MYYYNSRTGYWTLVQNNQVMEFVTEEELLEYLDDLS